ncbi:ATP-dependent RNA helicase DDX51 [Amphibalanus amphitrite]|uniref:ATP-dependent RNA helicase DDX51 n=1 Tax=Amphibalanus amphitrite TaxID=1232801 RepID=A0A6A4W440_AMPAM|nr:ATP-dependent RNA helicase DDX51 [Amphibalanus amphitrite]
MHHLLRQPDWRRSLVLVNWNEVAHQLELPLSVLGARVTEFCGVVPACRRRRALVAIPHKANRSPLQSIGESPLPPADLCVSAPAGRGTTLAFVLPVVQARAPAAGCAR